MKKALFILLLALAASVGVNAKEGTGVFIDDDIISILFKADPCAWEVKYQLEELSDGNLELEIINPFIGMKTGQDDYGIYDAFPYNDPGDWDDSKDYNILLRINTTSNEVVFVNQKNDLGVDWGYGMMYLSQEDAIGTYDAPNETITFLYDDHTLNFGMEGLTSSYAGFRFVLSKDAYIAQYPDKKFGDVYYILDDANHTAEVTSNPFRFSGAIDIPGTIEFNGITYSVTSIGDDAFAECDYMTSISIGNNVTIIGSYAFFGCDDLASVTLGNSVTNIEYAAFYHCPSLTSIVIPCSVTDIEDFAFYSCTGLTSITCEGVTPPSCNGDYVFYNVEKSIPLYVPAGRAETYKEANGWKDFNIQEIATGIKTPSGTVNAVKILRNGQMYIIRNGEKYNMQGAKIEY